MTRTSPRLRTGFAIVLSAALAAISAAPASASAPKVVGSLTDSSLTGASSVEVSGHYAYVSGYSQDRINVIDVANPRAPREVGSISSPLLHGPATLTVRGSRVYVASKDANALTVVDASNPAAPAILGTVHDDERLNGAYGVDVVGSLAYVAAQGCVVGRPCASHSAGNRLVIVDVSNPAAPGIVGELHDDEFLHHVTAVAVVGDRAYLPAAYANRVTTVDVSNPAQPRMVGSVEHPRLAVGADIAVADGYAYVPGQGASAMVVVDVSSDTPKIAGVVDDPRLDNAYDLRVRGDYVYVASYRGNALVVIDVSDPTTPTIVGTATGATLQGADSVFLAGPFAYVAGFNANALSTVSVAGFDALRLSGLRQALSAKLSHARKVGRAKSLTLSFKAPSSGRIAVALRAPGPLAKGTARMRKGRTVRLKLPLSNAVRHKFRSVGGPQGWEAAVKVTGSGRASRRWSVVAKP